jgi:1,4-alpha-glucan branching enzyme
MATKTVEFQFITGLKRAMFHNARLRGSWDRNGRYSDDWTESPMQEEVGEDGCPIFKASISLDLADRDKTFKWGVVLDGPQGSNFWGIPTELQDVNSVERYRQFRVSSDGGRQVERYYFTYGRYLGANKYFAAGSAAPGLRFAVWAPNARKVEVVFGRPDRGYIADDGTDVDPGRPAVTLSASAGGIWEGKPQGNFQTSRACLTCIVSSTPKEKPSFAQIFSSAARSAEARSIRSRPLGRERWTLWTAL